MGRMLVFVGILSGLCCSVFAQSKGRPSAGTEQVVMGIERELLIAILKGDASASAIWPIRMCLRDLTAQPRTRHRLLRI